MTSPLAVITVLMSMLASAQAAGRSALQRPNIVVIMADDIGFECYGAYGSEFYSTPNVDQLARSGAMFTHAYAQPLCTPSRLKIMTGRYNFRNYTTFGRFDPSEPTFASILKDDGYATCVAGKWQLTPQDLEGPHKAGFDEYCLWHFAGEASDGREASAQLGGQGSRYKGPKLFRNGALVPRGGGGYGPDIVTDHIIDFMDRKQDVPFLVYYPMMLVHHPFEPTPDSRDWKRMNRSKPDLKHFSEMVTYMDRIIGRIVAKLDQLGLREKTLILVTGDNGTHRKITSPFPERGGIRGGKGLMADAGTRVAFVASWTGQVQPGTVIDSPIDFADVLPTICEAADSKISDTVDGRSFLPLLRGDASSARGWSFVSFSAHGPKVAPFRCFVRDERWKLYADGDLFDIPGDWLEESPAVGEDADLARKRLAPILERVLADAPRDQIQR